MDPNDWSESCILLETYRRNGQPVETPVWFAVKDGLIYIVTRERTGKVRRLRGNRHVRVAPCTMRGSIRGEWRSGTAEILSGSRMDEAVRMREKKYGIRARIAQFVSRGKGDLFAFAVRLD